MHQHLSCLNGQAQRLVQSSPCVELCAMVIGRRCVLSPWRAPDQEKCSK